jgi:cytochrome P450 family 138
MALPPGPTRLPAFVQTALFLGFQTQTARTLQRRYGDAFQVQVSGLGTFVVVADPDLLRQVFTADPKVLHAGDRSPLGAVLGRNSLLAIDEERHLSQRKLLLPPFHGERMQSYEAIIEEEALRELATWPQDQPFATLEPMMRITLNSILRAVFGAQGSELEQLRRLLPGLVALGSRLALLRFAHRDLGPWSPWGRFLRMRAQFDRHVEGLIATARRDPALEERSDVLSLLVRARHEDGTPMSREEIADQLLTLLAAGHETTAATLAWAVERLRRNPAVLRRLVAEVDAGGREYRDAVIREVQRSRPVITAAGRFAMVDFQLGRWLLPAGTRIVASAYLTQRDARIYPDPERFDPERFLASKPGTYTWVPFGGGIRRCIGAAFAHMEMDVVLRTVLQQLELATTSAPDERWRSRGVAFVPARGGRAVVRRRRDRGAGPAPSAQATAETVGAPLAAST